MKSHRYLSDSEFLQQLRSASLHASSFDHEAHLRLAWLLLKQYDKARAILETCGILQHYVTEQGVSNKFNKTLTVAAVEAVAHFMRKKEVHSFQDFILANPSLSSDFKGLLQTHYSFDIFLSNRAKSDYIAPDLAPFL